MSDGRLAGDAPTITPMRIALARRKAAKLGVACTVDLSADAVEEGLRAVDSVGREGTFRSRPVGRAARLMLVFVADDEEDLTRRGA